MSEHEQRVRESQGGFSIISVLVAMVLLGIGIVALSSTGVYVLAVQTEASVRSQAAGVAAAYMEEVKTRDPTTLASESPVAITETGQVDPGGKFTRTLEVTDGPAVDSKLVTVTVDYPTGRGRTGTVELVTIIYEGT